MRSIQVDYQDGGIPADYEECAAVGALLVYVRAGRMIDVRDTAAHLRRAYGDKEKARAQAILSRSQKR